MNEFYPEESVSLFDDPYKFSAIVAKSVHDNAIGRNGFMAWYIKEDLEYFKRKTTGHIVVMGSKTFESLKCRPLPGRTNIVLTSSDKYKDRGDIIVKKSVDEVISYVSDLSNKGNLMKPEVFIIGGENVYRQFMDLCSTLYVSEVNMKVEGADTFFPEIDYKKWFCELEAGSQGSKVVFKKYVKRNKELDH